MAKQHQNKQAVVIAAEAEAEAAKARARHLQQLPEEEEREWHQFELLHGLHSQDGTTYEKGAKFDAPYDAIERLDPWWDKFKDLGQHNPENTRQLDERKKAREERKRAEARDRQLKEERVQQEQRERDERRRQMSGRNVPNTGGAAKDVGVGHPYVGEMQQRPTGLAHEGSAPGDRVGPGPGQGPQGLSPVPHGTVGGPGVVREGEQGDQNRGDFNPGQEARDKT